jgi:hypothetical protein
MCKVQVGRCEQTLYLKMATHIDREDEEHIGAGAERLIELDLVMPLGGPHAVCHGTLYVFVVVALQDEVPVVAWPW